LEALFDQSRKAFPFQIAKFLKKKSSPYFSPFLKLLLKAVIASILNAYKLKIKFFLKG